MTGKTDGIENAAFSLETLALSELRAVLEDPTSSVTARRNAAEIVLRDARARPKDADGAVSKMPRAVLLAEIRRCQALLASK